MSGESRHRGQGEERLSLSVWRCKTQQSKSCPRILVTLADSQVHMHSLNSMSWQVRCRRSSHFFPSTSFCTASILYLDLDVPVRKRTESQEAHVSTYGWPDSQEWTDGRLNIARCFEWIDSVLEFWRCGEVNGHTRPSKMASMQIEIQTYHTDSVVPAKKAPSCLSESCLSHALIPLQAGRVTMGVEAHGRQPTVCIRTSWPPHVLMSRGQGT